MANSGGSWITYKGRRIYIGGKKGGSSAGKGKGKTQKKISDIDLANIDREKLDNGKRKANDHFYKNIKDRMERKKQVDKEIKKMGMDPDTYSSDAREDIKYNLKGVKSLSGELEKDNKGRVVSQEEYDAFRQAYKDGKISQKDYRNDNYDALKNTQKEINKEKADYAKRKAEEYRNTKDPMFQDVKEQRAKEYEKQAKEYEEYYKKEGLGEPSNYQNGDKIVFDNGYYNTVKGTVLREATEQEKKYVINNNLKGYMVRDVNGFEYVVPDTRIIKQSSNPDWVKNAFKQYKKNHPESKFTIQDFMKNYK